MRIGIAQIRSTDDPWENLCTVQSFYWESLEHKLSLLCFPENVFFRGPRNGGAYPRIESHVPVKRNSDHTVEIIPDTPFAEELKIFLSEIKYPLSLGSVLEESKEHEKPANAHWICYPNGKIISYRKIHLFDFSSPQAQYRESDDVVAGSHIVSAEIEKARVGLSICFDLRFSELFRNLTFSHKTQVLLIPAAFTLETGEKHWHTLLKARAIENLSYVVAAGQWGSHKNAQGQDLFCYGNSAIYDPWGELLAVAPLKGDALISAEIDLEKVARVRKNLPALPAARLNLNF